MKFLIVWKLNYENVVYLIETDNPELQELIKYAHDKKYGGVEDTKLEQLYQTLKDVKPMYDPFDYDNKDQIKLIEGTVSLIVTGQMVE